jgi:hypothetical protein
MLSLGNIFKVISKLISGDIGINVKIIKPFIWYVWTLVFVINRDETLDRLDELVKSGILEPFDRAVLNSLIDEAGKKTKEWVEK